VKNYREISLLITCYKNIEKLKSQAENVLSGPQNGFRKSRSCIDPLFSMKLLLEKGKEFNLETQLAFLDYVKAFDKSCLKYYKAKIIPIYY
jgi:hypothetical protein